MTTKYFINPFALNGDKTEINDAQNTDGTVSYAQGYSFDYQRDLSIDPAAKAPDRLTFNGILYDITTAIIQYQQNSTPDWQSFQTYPNYARVRYNDIVYESRVDSNTNNRPDVTPVAWSAVQAIANYALTSNITSPVQANWTQSNTADLSYIRNKPTNVSAFINDAGYVNAAGAISAVSPYLNGFSSSEFDPPTGVLPSNGGAFYIINSNQTLPVTANFKVGQSICILNNNPISQSILTVNDLVNDSIIGFTMGGNSSNKTLNLPPFGAICLTLYFGGLNGVWVLKSFSYPSLGTYNQSWADVTSSRASGATYTNTSGNAIMCCVTFPDTAGSSAFATVIVGGVTLFQVQYDGGSQVGNIAQSFIVSNGATYQVTGTAGISKWVEFR